MGDPNGPIGPSTRCPMPAPRGGFLAGDLLVAHVLAAFNDFFDTSTDITPSEAGWTEVVQDHIGDLAVDVQGQRFAVFYRFSNGTEPSDYGFEWTADAGNTVRITAYRGVDTGDPIINSAVVQTGPSDSVTAFTASIVTTRANTHLMACFACAPALGGPFFTNPSEDIRWYTQDDTGYRNNKGNGNLDFPEIMLNGDVIQAVAGATGTKQATIDMTASPTRIVFGHLLALQPKQF
jgi:hypothetical protein